IEMSTLLPYDNGQIQLIPPELAVQHYDSFLHIERQSRQLQRDLQTLLDAQSAGLAAGLSGPAGDDTTSNGSLTPTPTPSQFSSSSHSAITIPVRQPAKKKIGLRGARRGILKTMHTLLSLKEEERRLIDSELKNRRLAVKEVESFVTKQSGLEKAIAEIQMNGGSLRAENLMRAARTLETDIRDLESKLLQMKSQHRYILNEVSQIQNSVDAQLSSYKASLALVQTDVSNYLRSPPIRPLVPPSATPPPFYTLNPKRRTLEMANEQWVLEQGELRSKRHKVDLEIEALREGGGVWQKAVSDISNFEKLLRQEMRSLQQGSQVLQPRDRDSSINHEQTVLKELDDIASQLETRLQLAEQKNWNLLICCIGAELEAFREARRLLLEAFPALGDGKGAGLSKGATEVSLNFQEDTAAADSRKTIDSKEQSPASVENTTVESLHSPVQSSRSEDDDEPDPAWLLSE
ncbi:Atg28p, partial [Blastomyces dermatitidis ER-3]